MMSGKSAHLFASLLIVIVAVAFVAGCGDDGTSPPVDGDETMPQSVFKLDRHSLMMLRAWSFSPDLTYATGMFVSVAKLTSEGTVMEQTGAYPILMDIWASSPSDIFAVGYDGIGQHGSIFHYNGRVWTEMLHPLQNRLSGVFGTSRNNVYASGSSSIYHYDGSDWTSSLDYDEPLYGIDGVASNNIYAVGVNGTILHYSGSAWTPI
ncbi:MAG: hypothetical protein KAJ17_04255, partial [Candidatus Krumholzibacteria bacterium]|nr:hypothetical protein [Candidatus Krumholzibacteria bacterium]